ncbi:DASH complex subunit Dad1-domain-containing protein [Syncephalis fuscata]|nr:DASH complex subunit Dad1-domain-containing protein [Syncephalis fuscata]
MDDQAIFERERDVLINEIAQSIENVVTNMNLLNQNLDNIVTLGRDFEHIATLWANFRNSVVSDDVNQLF